MECIYRRFGEGCCLVSSGSEQSVYLHNNRHGVIFQKSCNSINIDMTILHLAIFFCVCMMLDTRFWWGNLRERDHWGDQDVDGRIILRWIFRKWEGVVRTRWSWLRIGTGGGRFWVRWWTFVFHKMRGISSKPISFSRRTLLHGVSKCEVRLCE